MQAPARGALLSVKAIADRASVSSLWNERLILDKILHPKPQESGFPILEAVSELRARRRKLAAAPRVQRTSAYKLHTAHPAAAASPPLRTPPAGALELMRQPAVTTKEIEQFLVRNYALDGPGYTMSDRINQGILDLVAASTPNNLRTLMLFLARYWQSGIASGVRPTIQASREHARALLLQSLHSHPATRHDGSREEVGIHDLARFEAFVRSFFDYMDVPHRPGDELDDLLLRLHVRCGSLSQTTELVSAAQRRAPLSAEAVELYLEALASSTPTTDQLLRLKPVLLNAATGEAVVVFLLPHVQTPTEVLDLLAHADASDLRNQIYAGAQSKIVSRLVELDGFSLVFPVLQRIRAHAPLNRETLAAALSGAIARQNKSAIKQLLDMACSGDLADSSWEDSEIVARARSALR